MDDQVNRLVDKAWKKVHDLTPSQRLLIGVGGMPGSGKTTLAALVVRQLNSRYAEQAPGVATTSPIAAFVPMDGYHLTRAQLSAMPDPVTAHARRGAAFTFDGDSFLALVTRLRAPIAAETGTIFAPSFDHAVKDPVADDIAVARDVRVVVFEGNYCCLARAPWAAAAALMDERWFVDVPFDVARRRLVRRHVEAGIAHDEDEAMRRAEENDLVNGKEIVENRVEIDEMIRSVEDSDWAPEEQDGKESGGT